MNTKIYLFNLCDNSFYEICFIQITQLTVYYMVSFIINNIKSLQKCNDGLTVEETFFSKLNKFY